MMEQLKNADRLVLSESYIALFLYVKSRAQELDMIEGRVHKLLRAVVV